MELTDGVQAGYDGCISIYRSSSQFPAHQSRNYYLLYAYNEAASYLFEIGYVASRR
jgi:hypothetical protein